MVTKMGGANIFFKKVTFAFTFQENIIFFIISLVLTGQCKQF